MEEVVGLQHVVTTLDVDTAEEIIDEVDADDMGISKLTLLSLVVG